MKLNAISIDHPIAATIAPANAVLARRPVPPSAAASVARHTPANHSSATVENAAMIEAAMAWSSLSRQYVMTSAMGSFASGRLAPDDHGDDHQHDEQHSGQRRITLQAMHLASPRR